jgi:hypothetical protein
MTMLEDMLRLYRFQIQSLLRTIDLARATMPTNTPELSQLLMDPGGGRKAVEFISLRLEMEVKSTIELLKELSINPDATHLPTEDQRLLHFSRLWFSTLTSVKQAMRHSSDRQTGEAELRQLLGMEVPVYE